LAFCCDVTDEARVQSLAAAAFKAFGRIDVWVNNAAVTVFGPFDRIPASDFRRVIDVNVFGYIHGARSVLPYFLKKKRGTLINVASMTGVLGQPYTLPYTISKFAVRGLSEGLSQEYARHRRIRICTFVPPLVDTPIFQQGANYMGQAVSVSPPIHDAVAVARALVRLAMHPREETYYGVEGRRISLLSRSFNPRRFDRRMEKKVMRSHFNKEPAPVTAGNLYRPMPLTASVSGGWKANGRYRPRTKAFLAVLFAVTALSFLRRRRAVAPAR
jgi:NAD(P)-dependent dehydrogenase (short-subunit alcohol dehydrogenase family)